MMGLLIVFHAIICVLLIIMILIQAGRGGGLVEGFSGVESMFGPKTSTFLTRTTSILSTLFLISCVSLAVLSARQSRSLLRDSGNGIPAAPVSPSNTTSQDNKQITPDQGPSKQENAKQEMPKQESAKPAATQKEPLKK